MKSENKILKVLLGLLMTILLFQAFFVLDLKMQNTALETENAELDYYKHTFKERVGTVYDEYGNPETIRVVSIDGGKNWLVTSRSREVQNERYLSIAYPNVNPDSLQEVQ